MPDPLEAALASLQLCEHHAKQLAILYKQYGIDDLVAKSPEEMQARIDAGPGINAKSFEPNLASITMMIGSLSEYYGLPPPSLAFTNPGCPACQIIKLGNLVVIEQCVQVCRDEAIRLGLKKSH